LRVKEALIKNILLFAIIGAGIGVLLAQVFPNLGKGSFESGLNDLAIGLGKQKPYLNFAAIGALAGAAVGALNRK